MVKNKKPEQYMLRYLSSRNNTSLHNRAVFQTVQIFAVFVCCLLLVLSCSNSKPVEHIKANAVVPTEAQLAYQQMEVIGFIHFTVNTFTDKEWGDGSEKPSVFDPTELDVTQWVEAAQKGGIRQLILTAKHHDGFCLWPSKFTEHSVKHSPWKEGKGDVVRELADACSTAGIKLGLYLSPWDRNHKDYGRPEYLTYYRNQLRELLTQYGDVTEIWFDGANGGTGWYGGANERRTIDRDTYYEWPETWALVKSLQPNVLIFSDAGPDIHWIGNEKGIAGETFWSTFNRDSVTVGGADRDYLNRGDANGPHWVVGECDVSIRPGWFYHASEDDKVKTPQQLVDLYYKSVGRNGTFLLNLPPDRRGLIHEKDVASLTEFRQILDETFKHNLAGKCTVAPSNIRSNLASVGGKMLTDMNADSYWACDDSVASATIELASTEPIIFDRIMLQEPIRLGQRISKVAVEVQTEGEWKKVSSATTVGYKRLLRIEPVKTQKIRIHILEANNTIALSEIGLYLSSSKENS